MDPESSLPNASLNENSLPSQGGLQNLVQKKWLLIFAGAILVAVLLAVTVLSKAPVQQLEMAEQNLPTAAPSTSLVSPAPTMTVEMKQAVSEAKLSATTYDDRQTTLRTDYPWLRKFPISGEGKYFVYFDLEKKVFIGKLYPRAGDSVEQLKAKALEHLRAREIPTDVYPIEWRVSSV